MDLVGGHRSDRLRRIDTDTHSPSLGPQRLDQSINLTLALIGYREMVSTGDHMGVFLTLAQANSITLNLESKSSTNNVVVTLFQFTLGAIDGI